MKYSLVLLLSLISTVVNANPNAVSCAAYCVYGKESAVIVRATKTIDGEPSQASEPPIYKFITADGATYGKTLQMLYTKCEKLNGQLRLEDNAAEGGQMIVNMKSACRENPK